MLAILICVFKTCNLYRIMFYEKFFSNTKHYHGLFSAYLRLSCLVVYLPFDKVVYTKRSTPLLKEEAKFSGEFLKRNKYFSYSCLDIYSI